MNLPLTLVVGKGGVGRSTVARALSWEATLRGTRSVCVELGTGGGTDVPVGPTGARPNVLVLDPATAVEAAAAAVFGSRRVARALLGNFAMQRLLDVIPAIREYALLVAALDLVRSHDHVVVDMPATGHALAWLGVADSLGRLVPSGRARAQADRLDATLRSPEASAIIVVTLTEALVLAETRELRDALRVQLGRDADRCVVNRAPALLADGSRTARDLAARAPALADPAQQLAAWLERREQARAHAEAASGALPTVWLRDFGGPPDLGVIARALAVETAS